MLGMLILLVGVLATGCGGSLSEPVDLGANPPGVPTPGVRPIDRSGRVTYPMSSEITAEQAAAMGAGEPSESSKGPGDGQTPDSEQPAVAPAEDADASDEKAKDENP